MENICRTCLRTPDNLLPLYNDESLINKIKIISSVQLINDENYPSTICSECITNVNNFFNFRKVIINSDKDLKERSAKLLRTKQSTIVTKSNNRNTTKICNIEIKNEHTNNTDDTDLEPEEYETNIQDNNNQSDSDEPETQLTAIKKIKLKTSVQEAIEMMKLNKCKECGKTFTSRFKLYNHRRTYHVTPGVCNICGIVVRADNLKRHVQLHSEGPAECRQCGKIFKNSESLRGHLLIHRGVVFTCEICGKQSRVKSEHSRHMKSHTNPEFNKIMCTICGKKVKDLRKHIQSHTGERPFSCIYCNKGFTSTYALKVHTRQHTNERPYSCKHCPMAFPQKVSLVTHLKSRHNQIVQMKELANY